MPATVTKTKPAVRRTLTGHVRAINNSKGYGFLMVADGTEYFFHKSACPQFAALTEGAVVRFLEGAPGEKGPRAERVELV